MTELVFILDRSGSMSGLESDTIGGFNSMLACLLLLLCEHGVEAADGVPLQPLHGTATVQDENKFRQILLHKTSP